MSVDSYAKFISEQQKSLVNNGLAEEKIEYNDYDEYADLIEAVIESLAEDIVDLQELSPETKKSYLHKATANLQRRALKHGRESNPRKKNWDHPGKAVRNRITGIGRAGGDAKSAEDSAVRMRNYANKAKKPLPNHDAAWDRGYSDRQVDFQVARDSGRKGKTTK